MTTNCNVKDACKCRELGTLPALGLRVLQYCAVCEPDLIKNQRFGNITYSTGTVRLAFDLHDQLFWNVLSHEVAHYVAFLSGVCDATDEVRMNALGAAISEMVRACLVTEMQI